MAIVRAQPFDFSIELWLDRQGDGKLCDMPVCSGLSFVASTKLHEILKPFFGESVRSREVEIRHKVKNTEFYHVFAIDQGAGSTDLNRGAELFMTARTSKTPVKIVDAYGIHFDASEWTGADIFRLGPFGNQMVVTKRVADELALTPLTGVETARADLYRYEEWEQYRRTGTHPLFGRI